MVRLAWEQVFKDRKKSGLMVLSLAVGMSVFLCMYTLIEDETRAYVDSFMDLDLIVQNDTLKKRVPEKHEHKIDQKLLDTIREIPGVKEIHVQRMADIVVPWEPGAADRWMANMYELWLDVPYEAEGRKEYQQHPEKYPSAMIGIDEATFAWLNATLSAPAEEERFLNGETCILYGSGLDAAGDYIGESISCREYAGAGHTASFEIAGVTMDPELSAMPSYAPGLIVSSRFLEKFASDPYVAKTGVYYEIAYDAQTESAIKAVLSKSPGERDISCTSRLEMLEEIKEAQGPLKAVGTGIVLILAWIGVLNYVNAAAGNIRSRRVEFSIMEGIGMTEKLLTGVLVLEGLLYAAGSLVLTMTAGVGATYLLHCTVSSHGLGFVLPVWPMIGAAILAGIICTSVPPAVCHRFTRRGTLVERMQEFE